MKLAACLALLAAPAAAQSFDDVATLEVLRGWQMADGTQLSALKITLAPGWKTYWRAPGDAGIPPRVNLSGSSNIASTRLMWPVPEVFDQVGMRSIGYHDGVVVPIEITPKDEGDAMQLSGLLEIGVCEEICIPVALEIDAQIMPGGSRDGEIAAALINRPLTAAEAGLTAATCNVSPLSDGLSVTATLTMPSAGQREDVVVEFADPAVWVSEPDVVRDGRTLQATVDMVHADGPSFALDRSAVRITVLGSSYAVDVRGCSAG